MSTRLCLPLAGEVDLIRKRLKWNSEWFNNINIDQQQPNEPYGEDELEAPLPGAGKIWQDKKQTTNLREMNDYGLGSGCPWIDVYLV